ncbi:hypothetical protein TRAPUB_4611 [Trametes pubescens]|uniref:Uncharacterized protein n=1 Tax=Trametes pubescens TaxID=154538 RepID=A0A1M2W7A7_TRAPU|nr:hypothetical protein TRAPUB_4611 [Trametes pubescens]
MSTALPPHPPAPTAPVAVLANAAALAARDADLGAPSFDALLHHLRQEVARVLDLHPDARHKEEQALLSLANRALARYTSPDKSAIPPPLLQIDAYQRAPNPAESLSKYLSARRAVLALDPDDPMDGGDKDAIGEPAHDSLDAGRDSDEDAIGSEHPRSPSLRPSDSPLAVHRQLEPRLPTPTPSSPRPTSGTAGNTTGELALPPYQFRNRANPFPTKAVSSPEPRSTVSAPPRGGQASDEKKPAAPPDSVDHTFKGDERCSNCISRNNPTCIVNSSRQRCDSCFVKRHRCSKVLTPPSRPSRESNSTSNNGGSVNKTASTSKGKAAGGEHPRGTMSARSPRGLPSPSSSADAPATTNGESASTRGPKRKRPAADAEEDTKRPEPAKRPVRPQRPTTTAPIASTSASASAPPARAPAPKREKPPAPNGVGVAATSASAGPNALAALAASASRAPRAPVNAQAPAGTRQQQYLDKLQVIAGILEMVQNSVKDLQDQIKADSAVRR